MCTCLCACALASAVSFLTLTFVITRTDAEPHPHPGNAGHIRVYQNGRPVDLTTVLPPQQIQYLKDKNLIGDDVVPPIDICTTARRLEDLGLDPLLTAGSITSPSYAASLRWGKKTQEIQPRPYPGCYLDVTVGEQQMLRVTMKDYSMKLSTGDSNDGCKKSFLEFSSFDLDGGLHHSRRVCCPRGAIPRQEVYLSPARTAFVRIRFVAEEPMVGKGWNLMYKLLPETAALR